MKTALIAVAAALLSALLLAPEVRRYGAEQQLGSADAAFELLLERSSEVRNAGDVLSRVSERAAIAARRLPGDSRGWVLAGSCELVAGHPDRALGFYRQALATGERAEIHLNLGRAEALVNRREAAVAAFVRAVWISPALLRAVPPGFVDPVSVEMARLEAALREGRLAEPPPVPR
jgi:cytochrome c-type biogenesis protein CcmH/NrfG